MRLTWLRLKRWYLERRRELAASELYDLEARYAEYRPHYEHQVAALEARLQRIAHQIAVESMP